MVPLALFGASASARDGTRCAHPLLHDGVDPPVAASARGATTASRAALRGGLSHEKIKEIFELELVSHVMES